MGTAGSLAAVLVAVLVFLVLRELWCWYWKINAALDELIGIRAELAQLNAREAKKAQAYQGEFAPRPE